MPTPGDSNDDDAIIYFGARDIRFDATVRTPRPDTGNRLHATVHATVSSCKPALYGLTATTVLWRGVLDAVSGRLKPAASISPGMSSATYSCRNGSVDLKAVKTKGLEQMRWNVCGSGEGNTERSRRSVDGGASHCPLHMAWRRVVLRL